MSKPPINPEKTAAGIAVDPQTLERVIPESKRPDGTVRKQIKIRPGFTPQEDVRRFRGTRQAQMDANTLPKGHIIGWAPPPTSTASASTGKPMSKSAKKNAKRKEKREEKKVEVPEDWDADDGETNEKSTTVTPPDSQHTTEQPNWAAAAQTDSKDEAVSGITTSLEKLDVE